MRIQTNVSALNAWRNLSITNTNLTQSMEWLSSGYRINRAADDAAGLAISEKMRGQIKGLTQAVRNAQDGISLIQTAEGALAETTAMLHRFEQLAVQASNDTNTDSDRAKLQDEVTALIAEINRIATDTEFNGKALLNGSYASNGLVFQIGANSGQVLSVTVGNMAASALTGLASINLSNRSDAQAAIGVIATALETVSTQRAALGAVQNRLQHTVNNLNVAVENLSAAESRIRDVDMAQEMTNFTRQQILLQAGTAMLAQANAKPQSVLQLLG